jgi:mRNA-degrading endonuclease toxin of MazEF toxin-antitoxin module
MVKSYVPARGDIVWLDFNSQAGHEQAGHRPALVISPKIYNEKSGLLLADIESQRLSFWGGAKRWRVCVG